MNSGLTKGQREEDGRTGRQAEVQGPGGSWGQNA